MLLRKIIQKIGHFLHKTFRVQFLDNIFYLIFPKMKKPAFFQEFKNIKGKM